MTELHNMSVPPRSFLTLRRAELYGRRYRVALDAPACGRKGLTDDVLTRYFREDGAACALALLDPGAKVTRAEFREQVANFGSKADAKAALRSLCETALGSVGLPAGFGFFVEEKPSLRCDTLSVAAAIAILAARSGPLYLPGRFEPSLIKAGTVTLFFPVVDERGGVR